MMTGTTQDSATSRPLPLRMRADLTVHPVRYGRRRFWGVKDPVSLRYFHLCDEEYAILQMLDGVTSLETIQTEFERRYAPSRLRLEQLQSFLGDLHGRGLVVVDAPGQDGVLLQRRQRYRRRKWLQAASSILAIRFRGIDPEPLLCRLYPSLRWLFSPACFVLCLLAVLAAAVLAVVQFDTLTARLPEFHIFFSAQNIVWLAVAIAIAKVLHEFGHALTCKHFGGECHEMGIMLLAFTPCLYCNVSDAWMLPNKWHRIAIGAAGMCVELVLAAVCLFLWWCSEPGLLNSICLNLVFVCSVSTLVFNGNPLLRFDGYYVFADLVEVPNLRQQAGLLVRNALARWFLGIDLAVERMLPQHLRGLLAAYGVASALYRCFVIVAILWFVSQVLQPYGLQVLAHAVTLVVLGGFLLVPLWQLAGFFRNPVRSRDMNRRRLLIRGGLAAAGVVAALALPWPHRITAPAVLEPKDARHVYVSAPGQLIERVAVGDTVQSGQLLARLEDLELRLEVEKLRGQSGQLRLHLSHLKRQQVTDPSAVAEIPTVEEKLADIDDRLRQRSRDLEQLTLTAPAAGTVLPTSPRPASSSSLGLPTWSGTPLDERNMGCYLERGTLFCRIGDPERLEAVLAVDQTDIDCVRAGQLVRVQLEALPGQVLSGTVSEIARMDLQVASQELAAHDDFTTRASPHGLPRPTNAAYQVRVSLDEHRVRPQINSSGRAKIHVAPRSWGVRLYRYLRYTFGLEL